MKLTEGRDSSPAFSPDGSRIAFVRGDGDGDSQIYVMNADGSDQRVLVAAGRESVDEPRWSADGTLLAYTRYSEGGVRLVSSIETVAVGGGAPAVAARARLSARTPFILGTPAFVPGTGRIAYSRTEFTDDGELVPQLRTVEADGSDDRLLRAEATGAAWSADGGRIAFANLADRNGLSCGSDFCTPNGEIYVMNADGTGARRLTKNRGDDAGPRWSADGTRILFSSDRNKPGVSGPELYSIGADGSCLTWLTNGTAASSSPDASPTAGDLAPDDCGEAGRRAWAEVRPQAPRKAKGPLYWLGRRSQGLLLSDVARAGRTTFVDYSECARFRPKDCRRAVLLGHDDVCEDPSLLSPGAGLPNRYLWRKGALVVGFANGFEPAVVSGGRTISVLAGTKDPRAVLGIVNRLRPLSSRGAAKRLPPPRIPRGLLLKARSVRRSLAAGASVSEIAADLDRGEFQVRGLAKLAAADHRLGPFAAARC